ncbi:uncharacterized protein EI90DRAFT_539829 [Cantharellus anzutake]|uniref:uncharacterized protein n=1 Tax=Cantharellus anzutake TaxID=1750568 RepID=UPI0019067DBB|nr:uncharacterized protein EI90DRAFT_539829 [Cantharellus anzutake]KAF8334343.1 hypothetical protein EI90DRAFT_539829 [Cantharellus anzutake]
MSASARKAGGLYGGINLLSTTTPAGLAADIVAVTAPGAVNATTKTEPSVAPTTKTEAPKEEEFSKPAAGTKAWSASLAFAPTRRPAPKAKPVATRLPASAFTSSSSSASSTISATAVLYASPDLDEAAAASSSLNNLLLQEADNNNNNNNNNSKLLLASEPSSTVTGVGSSNADWSGRKIKPPSMVLDDNVNGFRGPSAASRKSHHRQQRNKIGKGKKSKQNAQAAPVWDPDEQYDPLKPNDFSELVAQRVRAREEERQAREDERRRQRDRKRSRRSSSYSASDDGYSDDNKDWRDRPRKEGRYDDSPPESWRTKEPAPIFSPPSSHSRLPPPDDGEPAYLRRAAMSANAGFQASSRLSPPPTSFEQTASNLVATPSAPVPQTGEEAYLRRLAMSQGAMTMTPPPPPPPPPAPLPVQELDEDDDVPYLSPPPMPPPQPAPPPLDPEVMEAQIKEKREAAAAIAARLAQFGQQAANASDKPEEDSPSEPKTSHNFAARMMAKWGHKEGQGLGVDASGIVEPLSVQVAKAAGGKKCNQKPSAGGFGAEGSRIAKIVNKLDEEKQRQERAKYGEPSTVVVLSNVVGLEDAEDEDLSEEIGGECSKHGVVNRILVHVVNPVPSNHDEAVRVFVQFTGPVGAWKTVRDFDGRYFGGRSVRARYFPEELFVRHQLDGPLV